MKIDEIIPNHRPSIYRPQVSIPLDDYNRVKPILQRQRKTRLPKPKPLTLSQLNKRLAAAHHEKLRRLAIALQNRKLWAQSELVTPQDKRDALKLGEPDVRVPNLNQWLGADGKIKFVGR